MTDFADDIRKIARGTRRKGALSPYAGRDPVLGGSVSLVTGEYQGVGETPTGSAPNSPTSQEDAGTNNTAPDPENPDSFYLGGTGGTNTSTETGTYDIEDVMDGTDGPQTSPKSNGDYSSGYDDAMTGFSGATDCDTGQCINFHTDGNFPTPDGWDDPDSPPLNAPELFTPGFYWERSGSPGVYEADPVSLYESIVSASGGGVEWVSGSVVQYPYAGDEDRALIGYYYKPSPSGSPIYAEDAAERLECFGPYGDNRDDLCALTEEDFRATAWPEDGCYDLALIDGNFTANQYDSEAPAGAGGGVVNFCFGTGRTGTVEATANGGYMLTETTPQDPGEIPHKTRVYDANGQFVAGGEATDQFQDQWRPK